MKKKIYMIFMLVVCCCVFFACNSEGKVKTLDTPTNLEVENQYICFDEVENASYYMINYDGNTVVVKPSYTGEIVYNASKILTESRTYEIKVKAIGEKNFLDSEYTEIVKYTKKQTFSAPSIEINGDILTWSIISGATSYTLEATLPNGNKQHFLYNTNGFDITSILYEPGVYKFRVKVGKEKDSNEYSGEVEYGFYKTLEEPKSLELMLDSKNDKLYLYMLVDEHSYEYNVMINNEQFYLSKEDIKNYSISTGYVNSLKVNLTDFLEAKGYTKTYKDVKVKVQAKSASTDYYINSDYSDITSLKTKTILESPVLELKKGGATSTLSWNNIDGAMSYVVYKNYEYFCMVNASSNLEIEFLNEEILNDVFSVSCIGGEYYYASRMSNVVAYALREKSGSTTLQFLNNKLSWSALTSATGYFLELSNDNFYYSTSLNSTELEFDLSNFGFGEYEAKLHVLSNNKLPFTVTKEINYTKKLENIKNGKIGDSASRYNVVFDKVEDAYGYVLYMKTNSEEEYIDVIFSNNIINLTPYVTTVGEYSIKVKAIASPFSNISDSDWEDLGKLQHAEKLETPELTSASVEEIDGEFYLKFDEIENAYRYRILINYIDLYSGGVEYNAEGYNISSLISSAQIYTIKVKALAQSGQTKYYDSDYGTCEYARYIQLNSINASDMEISFDEASNAYLLNFSTQTHVAEYEIRMIRVWGDNTSEEKFVISNVPYDITDKFMGAGVYSLYVTAKANNTEGYFYLDAPESSNPYVYEKFKTTLTKVKNISKPIKSSTSSSILLNWDAVSGADAYFVNIYYIAPNGEAERIVKKETVTSNVLDLDGIVTKEGRYRITIQATSNGDAYDSSIEETSYDFKMETKFDFERNKVYYGGVENSCLVSEYEQLKNLIYYSYLYENVVYPVGDGSYYQLKFILAPTIEDANKLIPEGLEEEVENLINSSTIGTREYKVLEALIKLALIQYGEAKGETSFVFTQGENDSYLFYCASGLNSEKIISFNNSTGTKFNQTSDKISGLQKRNDNYVFKLELLDKKAFVTTSEQLFIALQNGFTPNFVGNSASAKNIYNRAKTILREICVDSMTDYQKVLAIYNYLMNNVNYNFDFETKLVNSNSLIDTVTLDSGEIVKLGDFEHEFLEGVFGDGHTATSNGISKAFVLLCRLEGIEANKVNGEKDGKPYYWNQVNIIVPNNSEKCWYNVDISASYSLATLNRVKYQLPTHKYFLVTNNFMVNNLGVSQSGKNAITSYSYSANSNFEYVYKGNTISDNLKYNTSKTLDEYLQTVVDYVHYTCSSDIGKWVVIEIDLSNSTADLSAIKSQIVTSYTQIAKEKFGACNLACDVVLREYSGEKTIILYAKPNK